MTAASRSIALLVLGWTLVSAAPHRTPQPDTSQSVDIVVQFATGNPKHFSIPFRSGMTVFDVMKAAQTQPRGIHFEYKGSSPATLLLVSIDGVANQGAGPDKRNWTYRVNSILGDRSFGICKIAAPAHVLWQFDVYHPDEPMKPGACQ